MGGWKRAKGTQIVNCQTLLQAREPKDTHVSARTSGWFAKQTRSTYVSEGRSRLHRLRMGIIRGSFAREKGREYKLADLHAVRVLNSRTVLPAVSAQQQTLACIWAGLTRVYRVSWQFQAEQNCASFAHEQTKK